MTYVNSYNVMLLSNKAIHFIILDVVKTATGGVRAFRWRGPMDRRQSLLHSVPASCFLKDECFCATQEVWLEEQDKSQSPLMTSWNRTTILLDHLLVTQKSNFSFVQSLCCICMLTNTFIFCSPTDLGSSDTRKRNTGQ